MNKRKIVSEDILNLEWPSNPAISPDGGQVVYEKTVARGQEDDYETHLFLSDIQGTSRRALTNAGTTNIYPIWSPDGKHIAYLSNRSHGMQIWLQSLDGLEERCLTSFRHGISSILWAPDGKTIYGLVPIVPNGEAEVFAKNVTAEDAQNEVFVATKQWQNGPKRYNRLYHKNDGLGFQNSLKKQIVAIDVASGTFKQLTSGNNDAMEPTVSPDGKYIAFISAQGDESFIFGGKIFRVPTNGGEIELLFGEMKASTPSYSPDGKKLAFFIDQEHQKRLYMIPSMGGASICISKEYDDTLFDWTITDVRYYTYPQKAQWTKDSKSILALGTRLGRNEIVRFSVENSDIQPVVVIGGDRAIFHFSFDNNRTVVAAYSTVEHPGKITAIEIDENQTMEYKRRNPADSLEELCVPLFPKKEVRLDDSNDVFVSEVIVVEPEVFSYRSEDQWDIQGFVLKPANYEEGRKYPVILDIHGGPHGAFTLTYYHQLQVFAAQGYAVVYTNPRGSTGYGEEFTKAVHNDYGGKDMVDILNGLDAALYQFDYLDSNRVAVNGLSYGGFMTNWLVTHTDRFFTAVSEGSICNWISMYGTSDIGPVFVGAELGGTDFQTLWKFSPLAYVENVKTPLLLIHCENDLRCPIEQSEQFFSHIKKLGGEVEFLRIPNSSHLLLQIGQPSLRIARIDEMVGFINGHLPSKVLETKK